MESEEDPQTWGIANITVETRPAASDRVMEQVLAILLADRTEAEEREAS
ncbi:hypothetical protein [Propionibacterium freudenreichii]|nr:hypothetical protein [Propionibacterium freudenreichii]CEG94918.1 Protein of unknown function [Propionibacterium freudenreichii]